jgi:hypothetical protein
MSELVSYVESLCCLLYLGLDSSSTVHWRKVGGWDHPFIHSLRMEVVIIKVYAKMD